MPILLAAIGIGNSSTSNDLWLHMSKIIEGLSRYNIKWTSYSCDGANTERRLQRMLIKNADSTSTYTIPPPFKDFPAVPFTIARYKDCTIAVVQDAHHFLKTARNNLFSGARLLPLGNHTAIYRRIKEIAYADGSPLFRRDAV
jgi:hypothetical protein